MAAAAHVFPGYVLDEVELSASITNPNGGTKLVLGLIHSTSPAVTWNSASQAFVTVADFLANGGSALTEEAGSGYSRTVLTGVTCSKSGAVTTLNCTSPVTWLTSTISATYGFIYDKTTDTNDTTRLLVMYFDFGGTFTDTAGTFTFNVNASGLATWTSN